MRCVVYTKKSVLPGSPRSALNSLRQLTERRYARERKTPPSEGVQRRQPLVARNGADEVVVAAPAVRVAKRPPRRCPVGGRVSGRVTAAVFGLSPEVVVFLKMGDSSVLCAPRIMLVPAKPCGASRRFNMME